MREEIANLVHPVFNYGLNLQKRLHKGDKPLLDVEQGALKGLLLSNVEARRWASYGGDAPVETLGAPAGETGRHGEQFLGIRYALVCWLDELFTLDSPWQAEWNERKLEVTLYGTNDRAWKFWEQARRADTRSDVDALEGYFLCAMLGFTGELRESPDKLRAWTAATQSSLVQSRSRDWIPPPELDPPTRVPPLHGRERMQRMLLVAAVSLLVLIPVVVFLIVQSLAG
jgi:type VI secretion system protein ImpK